MNFSKVRYCSTSGGEQISFETACVYQEQGGFSRVTFSNGLTNYTIVVSKTKLNIKANGDISYDLSLSKNLKSEYLVKAQGISFKAEVFCKNLTVSTNSDSVLIDCEYTTDLSGYSQSFVVSIIIF